MKKISLGALVAILLISVFTSSVYASSPDQNQVQETDEVMDVEGNPEPEAIPAAWAAAKVAGAFAGKAAAGGFFGAAGAHAYDALVGNDEAQSADAYEEIEASDLEVVFD